MAEVWRITALGEVIELDIDRVTVEARRHYRQAGVYSFGRGLFARNDLLGSRTSYTYFHRLRKDQLVMSKLKAWEGAFAIVPQEFDGWLLSPEFPTYTVRASVILPAFLRLLVTDPSFRQLAAAKSKGMGGRKERVNPRALLEVEVSIPPLAQQCRIVDLLTAVDASLDEAERLSTAALTALQAIREELVDWSGDLAPLRTLCSIDSRLVDPTEPGYRDLGHIGIERIEARTGRLLTLKSATEDGVTSGKFVVDDHDVVYSKIRPELRKAVFPGRRALCSADAYPLRPADGVDPRFLLELLLSDQFAAQAVGKSGRTKMPKVNRKELLTIAVPVPSHAHQVRVGNLASGLRDVADAAASGTQALQALRSAFLTELLAGAREIPASYDRFLNGAA